MSYGVEILFSDALRSSEYSLLSVRVSIRLHPLVKIEDSEENRILFKSVYGNVQRATNYSRTVSRSIIQVFSIFFSNIWFKLHLHTCRYFRLFIYYHHGLKLRFKVLIYLKSLHLDSDTYYYYLKLIFTVVWKTVCIFQCFLIFVVGSGGGFTKGTPQHACGSFEKNLSTV